MTTLTNYVVPNQVSSDQFNTFEQTCATFAQLRSFVGSKGIQVFARGQMAANDGYGGAFYWNSGSTAADDNLNVIVPPGAASGAWNRVAQAQTFSTASWISVRAYGATGNGTTDDTAAIQAAYNTVPSSGGTVFFPAGTYLISQAILVPSNTLTVGTGVGSLVKAASSYEHTALGGYAMFINAGYLGTAPASYTVNQNISFDRLSLSYVNLQNVGGGGTHAIRMWCCTNVSVTNCNFAYGNDGTAFVSCRDTQVIGCIATNIENAAYDHWAGPQNARVIGNYMSPAAATPNAAGVLFNASDGTGTDTRVAQTCLVEGNTFYGNIGFDTLGSNDSAADLTILGNYINNPIAIVGRGAIARTKIIGNTITGPTAQPAVWIDQGSAAGSYTGTPSDTIITSNTMFGFTTSLVNLGAVRVYGTAIINDNQISGTYPNALVLSGGTAYGTGNLMVAGSSGTISGTLLSGVALSLPNGGTGFGQYDANGGLVRLTVQADGNVVMYGTSATGSGISVWSFGSHQNSPNLTLGVPLATNGGAYLTSGTGAPGGGTVGSSVSGSIYIRTDGASGSHIYISQGGGSWTAIAGV